jgi:hypothetical protein
MGTIKHIICATLFLTASLSFAKVHPQGEGLPLPWPFPWAKECPVKWQSLEGTYTLYNKMVDDQITLRVEMTSRYRVTVSRLAADGTVLNKGSVAFDSTDRELTVTLRPKFSGVDKIKANLRFYHKQGHASACTKDAIEPIVTLGDDEAEQIPFQMVRVDSDGK